MLDPITMAAIAGGTGLLSGLFSSGDSPKDEAMKEALKLVKEKLPYLSQSAYSKGDISTLVNVLSQIYRGGADVAAGKLGANLAEQFGATGTPAGQPQASMYVSELAPTIARGEELSGQATQWGAELFANMDAQTKSRVLGALQLISQLSAGRADMTPLQKGVAGFLQGANIAATGMGNVSKAWADMNKEYINLNDPNK